MKAAWEYWAFEDALEHAWARVKKDGHRRKVFKYNAEFGWDVRVADSQQG